jgi:hypothetical protein
MPMAIGESAMNSMRERPLSLLLSQFDISEQLHQ